YFATVRRDALRLTESREIATAMRELKAAHRVFEAEVARWPRAQRDHRRAGVEAYYRSSFVPRVRAFEADGGADAVDRYRPTDDVTTVLQALFIAENPNPEDARDRLDHPTGGGRYAAVHAQMNPFMRSAIHQAGYDDLFLIDHETGRIVYTVAKKPDFG